MKKDLHPEIHSIMIECSCGAKFPSKSTIDSDTRAEICSACHPFYTGEQRILKTGAVDKFYARQKKMEELKKASKK